MCSIHHYSISAIFAVSKIGCPGRQKAALPRPVEIDKTCGVQRVGVYDISNENSISTADISSFFKLFKLSILRGFGNYRKIIHIPKFDPKKGGKIIVIEKVTYCTPLEAGKNRLQIQIYIQNISIHFKYLTNYFRTFVEVYALLCPAMPRGFSLRPAPPCLALSRWKILRPAHP